jgi:hypothetical protein
MKRGGYLRPLLLSLSVVLVVVLSGCSSRQPVNFRVHTEPEGAHVIYRQDDLSWIYLGLTPLDVVEVIPEEKLKKEHTMSLRVMRCGYLDQVKEWTGTDLEREVREKGQVFWTPRLIKNTD